MDRYIKSKAQADLEGINKHIERSIDSFFTSLFTLITFRFSLIYDTTLGFFWVNDEEKDSSLVHRQGITAHWYYPEIVC